VYGEKGIVVSTVQIPNTKLSLTEGNYFSKGERNKKIIKLTI
jgi:hypothetical protein